ncbi:sensor domain-containing diguanylate cyclase [Cyanobium gracile UHCC 0139]|uniref:Sensor domain-containing diguanylate cyclase n=1 Tax=Cyanobium gracile UHCC 0139 TaxID=3110308 RepID=A0ABU5RX79_9CYAN|nr:sensor domain-containing diguanylate cyclase [Cyanobium gracile]MEA5392378.1 sensor domain-containing diguanylate cyclase [Cyanobium gracile UHCC 0139]
MKPPETPEDEELRLAKLRSLGLLDTGQESRFDRLTRLTQRIFKVPIAMVSLVDEHRQWSKSSVGPNAPEASRSTSFCGHAILGSDVFIVPDTLKDERFHDNPHVLGEPHVRFYAGCPLKVDHRRIGTLCIVDQAPRTLDGEQIEILKDLAGVVEQEVASTLLATRDGLTGLENRRGFVALAQQSLQLSTRQATPASLLYLDLDDFKRINEVHGHQAGNDLLISLADRIRDVCRDSDVVARLGGDHFVVLLINATREQAEIVVHRIKKALTHYTRLWEDGDAISFSFGITAYQPERHETIVELLADGEALMEEIKKLRNLHRDDGEMQELAAAEADHALAGFNNQLQERTS